jgi:hypothetical protein
LENNFNFMNPLSRILTVAGIGLLAGNVLAQTDTPYKVLDTTQLMGNGGIDYVYADNDARRVYVPRGGNTFVFDLDSHKYIGAITNVGGHGVAIDTATHHGFSSAGKVAMIRHADDGEDQGH